MNYDNSRSYEVEGDWDLPEEGFLCILYEDGEEAGRGYFDSWEDANDFGNDWL